MTAGKVAGQAFIWLQLAAHLAVRLPETSSHVAASGCTAARQIGKPSSAGDPHPLPAATCPLPGTVGPIRTPVQHLYSDSDCIPFDVIKLPWYCCDELIEQGPLLRRILGIPQSPEGKCLLEKKSVPEFARSIAPSRYCPGPRGFML